MYISDILINKLADEAERNSWTSEKNLSNLVHNEVRIPINQISEVVERVHAELERRKVLNPGNKASNTYRPVVVNSAGIFPC